jgi:hypothetical protein
MSSDNKFFQGETQVTTTISILIPTKDRQRQITRLLDSIRRLTGLERIHPEIIIGDNSSVDQECKRLNEAIGIANGVIPGAIGR